jgi:hypothetical protein
MYLLEQAVGLEKGRYFATEERVDMHAAALQHTYDVGAPSQLIALPTASEDHALLPVLGI